MGLFDRFKKQKKKIDPSLEQEIKKAKVDIETEEIKSVYPIDYESPFDAYHLGSGASLSSGALQRFYLSEIWVYSAINSIASSVATIPWGVYSKKLQDGKVTYEPSDDNDLSALIGFPNSYTSRKEFLELVLIDYHTVGNVYIYLSGVEKAKSYKLPTSMFRLNPSLITPEMSEDGPYIESYIMNSDFGTYKFNAKEIVHIRNPNPSNNLIGLSPLVPAFKNINLDKLITQNQLSFYKNGARLGGVVETSGALNKSQQAMLQRSFENKYTGSRNMHRTLFLPKGMEYKPVQANAVESELLEYAKYNRDAIISALKVPPIKLGFLEQSSYSNAEIQEKFYYNDTILPLLKTIEDAFNLHPFITPPDGTLKIQFDTSDITALREDYAILAETALKMLEGGLSTDEVREIVWKKEALEEKYANSAKPKVIAEIDNLNKETLAQEIPQNEEKSYEGDSARTAQDVTDSKATFEERVSELTSIFVEEGVPTAQAVHRALRQARAEYQVDLEGQPDPELQNINKESLDSNISEVQISQDVLREPEAKVERQPDETLQQCVSRAVPKLMDEGMNRDQAVAAAFSMCELKSSESHEQPQKDINRHKNTPEKYSHIDFKPPKDVAEAAKRGLELREEYGRGGTDVGIARARDLSNRENMTPDTIKRMVSFFARHQDNSDTPPEEGNGQIAWLLWGGDPGKRWSNKVNKQMEAADKEEKAQNASPDDKKHNHKVFISEDRYIVTTASEEKEGHTHKMYLEGQEYVSGPPKRKEDGSHTHSFKLPELGDSEAKDAVVESATGYEALSEEKKAMLDAHYKAFIERTDNLIDDRKKELDEFFSNYKKLLIKSMKKELKKHKQNYLIKQSDDELKRIISLKELDEFIEQWVEENHPALEDSVRKGFNNVLPSLSIDFDLTDEIVRDLVKEITLDQVKFYDETTRSQVNEVLKGEFAKGSTITEIGRAINNKFDEITAGRAQTIARTETLKVYSEAEQLRINEIEKSLPEQEVIATWITMLDADVRSGVKSDANHAKLHGTTKVKGEPWNDGLSDLRYPRDSKGAAGSVINCRCTLGYELKPRI